MPHRRNSATESGSGLRLRCNSSSRKQLFRAAQMAIIIHDVASALLEIIQFGIAPIAVGSRAARLQIIAAHVEILTGLRVRTIRETARVSGSAANVASVRSHT